MNIPAYTPTKLTPATAGDAVKAYVHARESTYVVRTSARALHEGGLAVTATCEQPATRPRRVPAQHERTFYVTSGRGGHLVVTPA